MNAAAPRPRRWRPARRGRPRSALAGRLSGARGRRRGQPRRPTPSAPRPRARLPARPRRPPRRAHRVVVRHRLAGPAGDATPRYGFQVTFFRSRTGLAADNPSRFAARQLLFAHAAVTDLARRRHQHDQRIARWSGAGAARRWPGRAGATPPCSWAPGRCGARRPPAARRVPRRRLHARPARCSRTQPLLLQGDAGFSRKGPKSDRPATTTASRSWRRTAASGRAAGSASRCTAAAWLDHEWSDEILHPEAVGWDWIGINLFDGSALTAFVLRRADGSALWAGGSFRAAGAAGAAPSPPDEVRFEPGRRWPARSTAATLPGAVAGADAGRPLRGARADGRAGTRQPRQHRHGVLGRPERTARRRRAGASAWATWR